MKSIKFYTLGCKVNQYDTQNIREQFIRAGFKELDNNKPADIYLINTCTVTQRADSGSLNLIRRAKRENPMAKILVTGCLTELDSDRIKGIGGITLVVKNRNKEHILNLFYTNLHELKAELSQIVDRNNSCGFDKSSCRFVLKTNRGISHFKGHTRAFLKIQDGCNNSCSYCKVPLVRGRSRSRPLSEIIQEAERLVKNGYKEIVLCGICLGAYGGDLKPPVSLVEVIDKLENIEGILRIRLSSIEAKDVSDRLIDKIAGSQKLCPHLHIPIQSGDDNILKKMNRHYTKADYLNLIKKIKAKIPLIAITTDVLAGFPGEAEENFQNTVEAVEEILPLKVHIFPYSRRLGTPAASHFADEINPDILGERIARLKNIAESCALQYKKHFLGQKMEVLIEGRSKENPLFWEGYTDNYLKVIVASGGNLKNQLIPVKLKGIVKDYILASLADFLLNK